EIASSVRQPRRHRGGPLCHPASTGVYGAITRHSCARGRVHFEEMALGAGGAAEVVAGLLVRRATHEVLLPIGKGGAAADGVQRATHVETRERFDIAAETFWIAAAPVQSVVAGAARGAVRAAGEIAELGSEFADLLAVGALAALTPADPVAAALLVREAA